MMELVEMPTWPVFRRGQVSKPAGSLDAYVGQTSELPEFRHAPSKTAVVKRLRNRLVPDDKDLWKAEPEAKVRAMTHFDRGYLATEDVARYTYTLVSAYVDCMRDKCLNNPRYRRYFYSFQEAVQGRGPIPSRENLDTLTGVNFVITGCSQSGRTAYIQRLRNIFGAPFRVVSPALPDIKLVWYFPIVVLQWPSCGTLKGLLEQIRDKFVSEIKDPASLTAVFRKMRGKSAESAIIAASVLLNVGLFVIDGANAQSLKGHVRDILKYLCRLQGHTNIPLLLSCTDVFMAGAKQLDSDVDAVLRGRIFAFPAMAVPPDNIEAILCGRSLHEVTADDLDKLDFWYQFNLWFWKAGLLSPQLEMPHHLPRWTFDVCHGRVGWLAAGFRALHEHLAWEPELLRNAGPKQALVAGIFETQLRTCEPARIAIKAYGVDPSSISRSAVKQYLDHLPFGAGSILAARSTGPLLGAGHV
ncbi:hypothetical protein SAMN05216466_12750 [Paraburkholderia phenazinium]|uniref:Uncharacterized protein n=1 Tax=Paraburkholderia phenazinium TaxID=60549 RepID=A0A1G8I0A5_9BURK|nr:ATP-binding protein [Paraburkholderia phenazinium]SDI12376.1 hypothetical protein SAMN05216466_117141 [Paraburkholderia phenazinium]SDI59666.1 hypothetical protein SAMN05216466_12750 [Paraburkholderia phenazinium]